MRRVKQISVTLPMLTGAYQNIRAVLNYGGSAVKPRGCSAIAISHGMNDSGQFQLNFNDDRYLPFEGLPVDDTSTLTLSFLMQQISKRDVTDIKRHHSPY